ncbi:MAG: hypothetical protein HOP32_03550 [Nitrospira sp.]|nr:hypothetical protein [Nitrospira sp.]
MNRWSLDWYSEDPYNANGSGIIFCMIDWLIVLIGVFVVFEPFPYHTTTFSNRYK